MAEQIYTTPMLIEGKNTREKFFNLAKEHCSLFFTTRYTLFIEDCTLMSEQDMNESDLNELRTYLYGIYQGYLLAKG